MEFRLAPASVDAPLHELRVSPSSLAALGAAASSAPLLFANQIPCWALADASQADGAVAAPQRVQYDPLRGGRHATYAK